MKKILAAILTAALLFSLSLPVYASDKPSQKEEVVYGILNSDGSVNNIYVVNIFNGGEITDYGSYTKANNLTSSEKLIQNGDRITVNTEADKLYYQGTLQSKELPWNIAVRYTLDGKDISGKELAGKSGALNISVAVAQNSKVNSTFFNNYALQITLKLDTKLCDNIKADNAVSAEAGGSKQLSYTVLPGKGTDISVTADVHNFEMEAITVNGIKLVLDFDIDYEEFTGEINKLTEAIKKLDDGAGNLLDGADQLSVGMKKYVDGLKAYKDGLSELGSGISKLNKGAAGLKDGLSQLTKQNDTLVNAALAIQQSAFDTANAGLSGMGLGLPVLTPQNYNTVLKDIPELASVKNQLDGAVQFTQGLKSYTGGVAQLSAGASNLADGTYRLKSSVSKITSPAADLYNAGVELNLAVKKLRDGLSSYKGGTNELRNGTSDVDTQIKNKINEVMNNIFGNGDETISFVSDKNTNTTSVQFVLRTDGIKQPETDHTSQTVQTVKLNFWQKLLKLFGL